VTAAYSVGLLTTQSVKKAPDAAAQLKKVETRLFYVRLVRFVLLAVFVSSLFPAIIRPGFSPALVGVRLPLSAVL
jgi:hypothetical protein